MDDGCEKRNKGARSQVWERLEERLKNKNKAAQKLHKRKI